MSCVVFPVFPSGDADRRLFAELAAGGLGRACGARLAGQDDCRVIVVTDDADAAAQAAALGLEVHRARLEADACPPGMPRGTQTAARLLLAGEVVAADAAVAFVDFRAPDVTAALVLGILDAVRRRAGVWIGLSEVDDHPIQFNIHLETVEVELHVRSDPTAGEGLGARVSRPFPLGLSGLPGPCGPLDLEQAGCRGFLRMPSDGLGAGFEPLAAVEALREAEGRGVVMQRAGGGLGDLGRRVLGRAAPWPERALLPAGGCLDEAGLLLTCTPDGEGLEVYARPLPAGTYRLAVYALAAEDVLGDPAWESWLRVEGEGPATVMAADRAFVGPLACLPAIPDDGLLVVLERQVEQGHADRVVALRMEDGGWDVEDGLIRVNRATCCQIMGRQDFPELWELDGVLLAVDAANLARLLSPAFADGARGYPLGPRSSAGRAVRLGLPIPAAGDAPRAGETARS